VSIDLAEKRICICLGAGGVGKTTTSAALALALAQRGKRVCVVTIDPARRLAAALGVEELGNEPRRVDARRLARHGAEVSGELWAMMLDPKRTFDELIGRLAPDERRRDEVLQNRIYRELSSAVAGSQEFTAIAKLYDLDREGRFDVIVLDTPPSRNAMDFLDAPMRLTQFFEGRALGVLLAPTGLAARVAGRSTSAVFSVLSRVTGVDFLTEVSAFFNAISAMIAGFSARAEAVAVLLRDSTTAFVVVASPEREPVDEAIALARELRRAGMGVDALLVNRVHLEQEPAADAEQVRAELVPALGERLAAAIAQSLRDFQTLVRRDAASVERLHRSAGGPAPVLVPHLPADVHDVEGLALVAGYLLS
jgi:anion-transporting  ArsA/GET3 family ATPase